MQRDRDSLKWIYNIQQISKHNRQMLSTKLIIIFTITYCRVYERTHAENCRIFIPKITVAKKFSKQCSVGAPLVTLQKVQSPLS